MTQDGQRFIVPRLQPLSRQLAALTLPIFAAAAATVVAVAYTRDVIAASSAAASTAASSDLPSAQFLAEQGLQIEEHTSELQSHKIGRASCRERV